jgi:cell wall-associated NlpC family hydrolase
LTIRTLTLAVVLLTTVAAVAESTYTVKRGDTLNKISHKFGVPVDALLKANKLETGAQLHRGQALTIPSTGRSVDQAPKGIGKAEVIGISAIPHAGPFDGSKALEQVEPGSTFTAVQVKPGWMKVELPNGFGWLPAELVNFTPNPAPPAVAVVALPAKPETKELAIKRIAATGNSLTKKALSYQGVRYRWGGTSRSGVDCSGFTSSVFKSQGIKLPRTSIEQSHVGSAVSKTELKPGDLVFFRTSRAYRVNHVGIFVGEGKFIHAATGAGHVKVSSLDEKYYLRCYATARRVADFEIGSRAAALSREASEG